MKSEEGDFYTKAEYIFNISFLRVLYKSNMDCHVCVPSQGGDQKTDWEGKLRIKKEGIVLSH